MSASIAHDGCLVWPGKVGIIGNGYTEPEVNKLRVGRIAFEPQTNIFKIYSGNGRNEKPETSFRFNEVKNVKVYGMKDTVCIFQLTQQNGKEKHYNVAIDFKGSRDPAKTSLFTSKSTPQSSTMAFRRTLSSTRSTPHPLLKRTKENRLERSYQDEKKEEGSFSSIRSTRASEADSPSTSKPKGKGKHGVITRQSKSNEKVMKAEEVPVKRQRVTAPEKTPSLYESLRSRNSTGFSKLAPRSSHHQRGSPSGLANMGNTCYMNSILQATFIIDSFSKSLFESFKFFKKEAFNSEHFIKRYLPLMEALSNLLSNRCSGSSLTMFLKSVLGCVSTAADKFRNNRQEDAHEFLTDMLSQLQSEFKEAVRQLNGRRPHFLVSSDPIRECFGYTLRRIFSCQKCQHETSVEEENTNFIVHISDERLKSGKFTFADILRDSMAEEIVDHVCEKCNASAAVMKHEFVKLPEHFIFVIRRYVYNQKSGHKHKLHAKVSMHKHLTFVTNEDIPNPQHRENQLKLAATGASTSKSGRNPKNAPLSRGIDNRWRDRKISTSKIGYVVEDIDEEETIHKAFDDLFKWCRKNVEVKAKVTPCKTASDEPNENANDLLYALSGGNEALYAKLREKIWNLLIANADLYASMYGKSEKVFRDFIKNKAKKVDLPPTNLELHACAALFEAVINVKENEKWISYIPKFVKLDDARKVVTSNHFHRKRFFLPANVNYVASILHTKRARSYSLSSVVCHVGQSTEGGHYKCAVQTSTGTWSMCNDDVVTNCHEKTVLDKSSDSGYILFYSVCSDRSPSPKREHTDDDEE
uniref:Ubiquitin carboxyl-terminal hydrolase n=1 Tax=Panagrolaimus sp. ES5 TaxID=591445 RepID=A0AC34FM15_9BILA